MHRRAVLWYQQQHQQQQSGHDEEGKAMSASERSCEIMTELMPC